MTEQVEDPPKDQWCPERAFPDSVTRKTVEHVFPLVDVGGGKIELVFAYDKDKLPAASFAVHTNQGALLKAASAVGRLLGLFTIGNIKANWEDYTIVSGTAFYVAPDVLCTANHVLQPLHERIKMTLRSFFFTPTVFFPNNLFENALRQSGYKLEGVQSPEFYTELKNRGLWEVHVKPFFFEHTRRETDTVPEIDRGDRTWVVNDFAFLSVQQRSPVWFIPSAVLPTEGDLITLIAYAAKQEQSYYSETYGGRFIAPTANDFEAIFGGFNMKFLSPGNIAAECNEFALAHMANAETSSSGGPVLPTNSLHEPFSFLGVHVGALPSGNRNYIVHTHHKVFCQEYAYHVLPSIQKIIRECPQELSQEKRDQLKKYLKVVEAAYVPNYAEPDLVDVQKLLSEI